MEIDDAKGLMAVVEICHYEENRPVIGATIRFDAPKEFEGHLKGSFVKHLMRGDVSRWHRT